MLLQQRSDKKITFPGLWTNSCCSHPRYVDSEIEPTEYIGTKRAVIRRSNFELGITDLKTEDLHVGSRILYYANGCDTFAEYELDHIVFSKKDINHKDNPDEIKASEYVSLDDFDAFLEDRLNNYGEDITPWFRLIVNRSLKQWWRHLIEHNQFPDESEHIIRF